MSSPISPPTIQEMSRQIGLTDLPPAASAPSDATLAHASDSPPLDDYLEPEPSPDTFTTHPAFYNTGVSKAALVGGVGLVLFLGLASIFKVASPKGQSPVEVADAEAEVLEDPTLAALRKSQAAESRAKAKLALLAQSQASDDAPEAVVQSTPEETPSHASSSKLEPTAATTEAPSSAITPPAAPPPPAKITPSPVYSTVTPKPAAIPPPPVKAGITPRLATPSMTPAGRPPTPLIQADPMAEWQRLASAGSYGQVDARQGTDGLPRGADANATVSALFPGAEGWGNTSVTTAVAVETSPAPPEDASLGSPSTAAPLSDYFHRSPPQVQLVATAPSSVPMDVTTDPPPPTGQPGQASMTASAERAMAPQPEMAPAEWSDVATDPAPPQPAAAPVLAQDPERTILVGSSGQGHLVTPVIWAPDGSRGEARFIVSLSQPILDAQGQPALPPDTQFVVAAQNLDPDSGLVDLTVMALLIEGQEYEAPEGVFSVRDRQGGLLLGELRNQPNQGRGDTARVLTGALVQVGKLMNRPRSTRSSSTNGSFGNSQSSVTENSDPNYVGAVLEGGFEQFASVIEARQKAAAEALSKAPQLYQLKAKHPIQIFVNQSLSL